MELKIGVCKKCNNEKVIVNKKYELCETCNWERLHPSDGSYAENRVKKQNELRDKMVKKGSSLKRTPIKKKNYRIKPMSDKQKVIVERDEIVYEEVWNSKDHYCEECGCFLGEEFRNENGKIIDRFRYSHILGKDTHPEHRHNIHNFNLLCLKCHTRWEFGDKESMKIYEKNEPIIKELKNIC